MEPRPMNGVKITGGPLPRSIKVMVGDQELTTMSVDIRMRPDEITTAIIEMPVEHIDVELLTSGVTVEPIER